MTFPPANRATTPLNVKNGPSHIFFFLSQYSIHDPADIWQTSPAPWVPGRAVASAQPLFLRDLFHDKRSAIFRYIHFNIFCRKSKTITNRIIHFFNHNYPPGYPYSHSAIFWNDAAKRSDPNPNHHMPRAILRDRISASHWQSGFLRKSFQKETPGIRNPAPNRYGWNVSKNVNFPRNPKEAPKTTNIAGPIQHDAARKDANMVPMLEMFSVFISLKISFNTLHLLPSPSGNGIADPLYYAHRTLISKSNYKGLYDSALLMCFSTYLFKSNHVCEGFI